MSDKMILSFRKYKKSLDSIGYYVYALCEIDGEKRKPFYIGKGKGDRCLQHLKDARKSEKGEKISELVQLGKFGIDILRHGINTDKTAKLIEATCIDLLGVGELSNSVRGSGADMGRVSIEEIHSLKTSVQIQVDKKHSGLAFLLNTTYKSGMSELELFEATRGTWKNVPRDASIKYAYATYGGLVKEVYQIHSWVEAGTQQSWTKTSDTENRWEFIGKKADDEIRHRYIGKMIKKSRSYGQPFIKVGLE